jgi:hypothetical protein
LVQSDEDQYFEVQTLRFRPVQPKSLKDNAYDQRGRIHSKGITYYTIPISFHNCWLVGNSTYKNMTKKKMERVSTIILILLIELIRPSTTVAGSTSDEEGI